MPSDSPDQLRPAAEQPSDIGEVSRDAERLVITHAEAARNLPRGVGARDAAREIDTASEGDDRAQQAMFEDIDAILARVESGIAVERAALNALLDRLHNAA